MGLERGGWLSLSSLTPISFTVAWFLSVKGDVHNYLIKKVAEVSP